MNKLQIRFMLWVMMMLRLIYDHNDPGPSDEHIDAIGNLTQDLLDELRSE